MSVATKQDTIVRKLTDREAASRRASTLTARDVRSGARVRIWGLDGLWAVWSEGPDKGTWWLQPRDGGAVDVYRLLAEKPSRGGEITRAVMQGCIAVGTADLYLAVGTVRR